MNTEQKAKAYDEAVRKAKEALNSLGDDYICNHLTKDDIREMYANFFPELKESEDERIRKELIQRIKYDGNGKYDYNKEDYISYLEKQGEQKPIMIQWQGNNLKEVIDFTGKDKNFEKWFKSFEEYEKYVDDHNGIFKLFNSDGSHYEIPVGAWIVKTPDGYNVASKAKYKQNPADKVEPKFKVGDWITNGEEIGQVIEWNHTDCIGYKTNHGTEKAFNKEDISKWHLWTIQDAKDGDVLSWDNSKCITLFKNIYDEGSFISYGFVGHCTGIFEPRQAYHDIEGAHPATKEQRDTLMKAMADAGYTFDFEKKELRKIEQKPAEKPVWYDNMDDLIADGMIDEIQKSDLPEGSKHNRIYWINKHRVQPKQEWSEEDWSYIADLISYFSGSSLQHDTPDVISWLKSFRPQNRWKPSDEQIKTLDDAIIYINATDNFSGSLDVLKNILEQLKKLK